jgi:predicted short-subunit dehydrogenase-like oxidoreductase (DUF2520 family)
VSDNLVIVGPGRLGLALGAALAQVGAVEGLVYFGRALEPPPHPLFEAGRADYRLGPQPVPGSTTILVLAVPDQALAEVAYDLAASGTAPSGCAALHLSGALSNDVLLPLQRSGYAIGSLHPLQSIADPWGSGERLMGAAFAVAGEPGAIAAGRRLALALGGHVLVVPPKLRAVYHTAATVASNYVVALISFAVRLLSEVGIGEAEAVAAILPLVRGTLTNLEDLGVAAALTGPIARGDVDTVRLHLARLSAEDRVLYCALGKETLRLARVAGLDAERAAELEALLSTR